MSAVDPRYYSIRLLGPYHGTAQVVEMSGFRALSIDGHCWRLQIKQQGSRYAFHGVWYHNKKGSLIETAQTETYFSAMREMPALPFPLADFMELWMLDGKHQLPLALLSSRVSTENPPRIEEVSWRAAYPDDHEFIAPSLLIDLPDEDSQSIFPHNEVLHRCIHARADALRRAQWFSRNMEDGSGRGYGGCNIDVGLEGRTLDSYQFPELLVSEIGWDTDREAGLVLDYHHWQAPNLLTHNTVSPETRSRLEKHACRQAGKLYQIRQLLPEIINKEMVDTALVEAVIIRSAGTGSAI